MEVGTDQLMNILEEELERVQDSVYITLENCFISIHSFVEESIVQFNTHQETDDDIQFKNVVEFFIPEVAQYLLNTKTSCKLALDPLFLEKMELLNLARNQLETVARSGELVFSCQHLQKELEQEKEQIQLVLDFLSTHYLDLKLHAHEMIASTLKNVDQAGSRFQNNLSSQLWVDLEKQIGSDKRHRTSVIRDFYKGILHVLFGEGAVVDIKSFETRLMTAVQEVERSGDNVLDTFKNQCRRMNEDGDSKIVLTNPG